ncbi:glutamate receptor ionotropic, kainate glr-3-like isoform X2 [Palaemon carinicauda]|uniref:glutamate receptor ionotropic, kainate glr-3-like isoform X2 n=1 Tax=Palaemon carinicauda TaxID=392227 RepID=UPI0035B65236
MKFKDLKMSKGHLKLRERFIFLFTLAILCPVDGFLNQSEGQKFLRAYCNTLGYTNINIFLPNSGDAGPISAGVLRSLWKSGIRSLSVRKLDHMSLSENESDLLSSGLNVGFVEHPRDLEFFTNVSDQSVIRDYPWLLFGNISKVMESMDDPYLILDNQVTFAILNNATMSVELKEVYNVAVDLPPKIQSLGKWTSVGQMNIVKTSWVHRRSNLTGLHLRCTTLDQPPFLYLSMPDKDLNVEITGGYAGDVWHTLQDSYSCRQPPDGLWGSPSNGVWNGLVNELLNNNADVVVTSLDNSNARVRVIDFLIGLEEIGYQLVVRRPGLMERTWTSFTSELVPSSWIATIAFALLIPPFLCFCSHFSPQETEKISLKDAYICTVGAFSVQGSWLEVRSISTRIIFITIFLTTLLVYAHYTSALVSMLTVASTTTQITSLQNLLQNGMYSFGFEREISIQSYFENSQGGLFHDVWKELVRDPSNLPATSIEGITRVLEEKYVFMIEENLYRTEFSGVCGAVMIPGKYFIQQTGFAVQKGSPLLKIFNNQLMRMIDGGIFSRLWKAWQPPPPLCTSESVVALNIQQLFTAFLLLVFGLILAVIFLPCERLHWNMVGRDKAFGKSSVGPGNMNPDTPSPSNHFYSHNADAKSNSSPVLEINPSRTVLGISININNSNFW